MPGGERISRKEAEGYFLVCLSLSVQKGRVPAATLYLSAVAHERLLSGFHGADMEPLSCLLSLAPVICIAWSRESFVGQRFCSWLCFVFCAPGLPWGYADWPNNWSCWDSWDGRSGMMEMPLMIPDTRDGTCLCLH